MPFHQAWHGFLCDKYGASEQPAPLCHPEAAESDDEGFGAHLAGSGGRKGDKSGRGFRGRGSANLRVHCMNWQISLCHHLGVGSIAQQRFQQN